MSKLKKFLKPRYYDKQGNEISLLEWSKLIEDLNYRYIIKNQAKDYIISTVWLGLDHSFNPDSKHIFETIVFENGTLINMKRYSTIKEALSGHSILYNSYKTLASIIEPKKKDKKCKKNNHI